MVTPEILHKLLRYEPETGRFYWRERTPDLFVSATSAEGHCRCWNRRFAGKEAFTADRSGYRVAAIFGRRISGHRCAWAMSFGEWPSNDIDHINGNRADNRLANLRVVSRAENSKNQKIRSSNTSGINGVRWDSTCNRWVARITINGRLRKLGSFKTKDEAIQARNEADRRHGFHPNHGRRP